MAEPWVRDLLARIEEEEEGEKGDEARAGFQGLSSDLREAITSQVPSFMWNPDRGMDQLKAYLRSLSLTWKEWRCKVKRRGCSVGFDSYIVP
jgi:hypothetical protein